MTKTHAGAGLPLLFLACLLPPFILLAPVAFLIAGLAGALIARWHVLLVPVALNTVFALVAHDAQHTALYVGWTVVLCLGLAGGTAVRLRHETARLAVLGTALALAVLVVGYDVGGREPACSDTSDLPAAPEYRSGSSPWGQTCEALGADGRVLASETYPTETDWMVAGIVLVFPLGAWSLRRRVIPAT